VGSRDGKRRDGIARSGRRGWGKIGMEKLWRVGGAGKEGRNMPWWEGVAGGGKGRKS
jgi:hypothetical protein